MKRLFPRSPPLSLLVLVCIWCMRLVGRSQSQNTTSYATTDPSEASALISIFQNWDISITGDPCSGDTVDDSLPIESYIITCDCSFNNHTTCHITQLKVDALGATGTIPDELGNLTKLSNLNLAQNNFTGSIPAFIGNLREMQYLNLAQNCLAGSIPAFIGNLREMQYLNLSQNYFTGSIPAFIGNLTEMRHLTFAINALSGSIPKEIGNLQKLVSLSFGSNNFSGSLPSEMGNLVNLEQLYMDSAGVGGEIPSTFSNLVNLKTVWASDNPFNGTIPYFIGTWTNLSVLRLQGNSFQGPMPSSFSNLTSLTDLRISDVSNGSSSLAFISNMKSLTNLILRNNMISGEIPSYIPAYKSLKTLDLSFNNLTGEIPGLLFNHSSVLSYLFLGNNSLSGTLPSKKRTSLLNIDLSYNQLSGSFPSWVKQPGLQLNLVANNFVLPNSNSGSTFPGLNCLQRNFTCNQSSPIYSQFAINCGGSQSITSKSGIVYYEDNALLSAASYYATDPIKWAVSNVGEFAEDMGPTATYISNSPSRSLYSDLFQSSDSELFQSSRLSPSSLRYYGLGLENGNYTVNLKFAETAIESSGNWKSVGRRVFDIYVQGNLVLKDFDIKEAAGGVSFRVVEREFQALVSENYLEIHLFWAGKGTCCVPSPGTYGPSISAISVTPGFTPTATSSKKYKTGLVVGIAILVGVVFISIIIGFFILIQRKRLRKNQDEELLGISIDTFSYVVLKTATENFNPANKLGEGGFGVVYKGTLSDGRAVAVKQLSVASLQGKSQFVTEIATISAVQHRNLVELYGCCIEGDRRLLVYEYLENKSLDQALFGKTSLHLNWPTRFDICLGTARGLTYLHEESRLRIVHRDVKASNILLDTNLNPKISDFGLAKLYNDKKTHISTRVAGTIGYLAPEYAMRGHLTEKADVFAFGVVALEIVSGRPNSGTSLEEEKMFLLGWAWYLHESNRDLELVDLTLVEFDKAEALRVIGVALLCTQATPMLRPPMSRVVAMLSGDIEVRSITSKPGYLTDWQLNEITSFMSEDSSRISTERNGGGQQDTSSNGHSLPSTCQPLLHEIIGEGH